MFSEAEGLKSSAISVRLSCATSRAAMRYTIDGSDPRTSSEARDYLAGQALSIAAHTVLKAYAYAEGLLESGVSEAEYHFGIAVPVITPSSSGIHECSGSLDLDITSATPSVTVRFTSDGTEPTDTSPIWTNGTSYLPDPQETVTTTVKAKAFRTGWEASGTATSVFLRHPSASLDASFNGGATVVLDLSPGNEEYVFAAEEDAEGRILLAVYFYDGDAGLYTPALLRLTPSGLPDTSFGSGGDGLVGLGWNPGAILDVTIEASGDILVAGTRNNTAILSRFHDDGSPDTGFATEGAYSYASYAFSSVIVDSGDNLVAAASSGGSNSGISVVRLSPTGTALSISESWQLVLGSKPYTTNSSLVLQDPVSGDYYVSGSASYSILQGGVQAQYEFIRRIKLQGDGTMGYDPTFTASGYVLLGNGSTFGSGVGGFWLRSGSLVLSRFAGMASGDVATYYWHRIAYSGSVVSSTAFLSDSQSVGSMDARGRLHVATGDSSAAIRMYRLSETGSNDANYGDGGFAIAETGLQGARPIRTLVLGDGRILLSGTVEGTNGRDKVFFAKLWP